MVIFKSVKMKNFKIIRLFELNASRLRLILDLEKRKQEKKTNGLSY